ncbi:rho-gdp dissociation inhibitor [Lophium mytilinum]|uniref:Rho-gdp dissociation inhibitor n=1 Tax=Lophium mytilinum TaxID=390894 RepID=A0A6A6QXB8_9PEZI|nr:rho-gdp dissociation inhibitor [Lophium mytilinum]
MADHHDELQPEQTAGFKVGESKTIDEYHKLDQNDESLKKWKESLGLGAGKDISNPNDPRKCIIISLGLEVEGRPDIIIDLKAPGAIEALKDKPFSIKEGADFRMKAIFQVQHQILSGMKYLQVVKRKGITVNKLQEMIVC